MNIAIILAGGSGTRVGANVPKQFIKVRSKPILAYTLELFECNPNIDAIEVVCHKNWVNEVERICEEYAITKKRWLCVGGDTFQESTVNGVYNLKGRIADDDIVVISFGVSPLTPQEDIDDSIRVCREHGNAIAAADIDLCTCVKDDAYSTTQNIIRETLKGFANPWTFKYGELYDAYEQAKALNLLDTLEPHTTSVYFALGKRLWFSQCTTRYVKITHKEDVDVFEALLMLKKKREKEKEEAENDQLQRI